MLISYCHVPCLGEYVLEGTSQKLLSFCLWSFWTFVMYLLSPLGLAVEEGDAVAAAPAVAERCAAPSVWLCHGVVVKLVGAGWC